ncbi:MBL fold metallo-hydrolase [Mesorhizobium sp. A556]
MFRANIFHVVGRDADLVLDFGTGVTSLRNDLVIPEGKHVFAVATHSHIDHIGSFHEFEHRLGHAVEAQAFETMTDAYTLADHFREQVDCLAHLPKDGWDITDYRIPAAPLTAALGEGDTVDLGDRIYTILFLPGHSPGSIGLFDAKGGTLFSGDAIYEGTLIDDLPGGDKNAYRRTMQRLCELDVETVHGGHNACMTGDRMREIARGYLDRD